MIDKFIEENLERDAKSFVTNEDLYSRYLKFCMSNKIDPLTKTKMTNQLKIRNQGIKDIKHVGGVRHTIRYGLRLK